jgi:hypothetical protein
MRFRVLWLGLLAIGSASVAALAMEPPKSRAAAKVLETFDTAVAKARRDRNRELTAAAKTAAANLDRAKKAATRANDLDEANAIAAEVAALEGFVAGPRSLDLDATADWTPAIVLRAGESVAIAASGEWTFDINNHRSCGPDGMAIKNKPGEREGYLQGRFAGREFVVGSSCEFIADASAPLFLRIADPLRRDNSGQLRIQVQSR